MAEGKKKAVCKMAMSSLDVAAAADEMKSLCVGSPFISLQSFSSETKDFFEIRLGDVANSLKRSILCDFAPAPSLGEDVSAEAAASEPHFTCTAGSLLHEEGGAPKQTAKLSSTIAICPFSSVNGFRCHLKAVEVFHNDAPSKRKKQIKPQKNKFCDEVSTKLQGHILLNVTHVAHDRVIAFEFIRSDALPCVSSPFSFFSCPCEACASNEGPLKGSVMSSSCVREKSTKAAFTLFVELYAGNLVLVDIDNRVSSVLFTKTVEKSSNEQKRREKGMLYQPYFHNNISREALQSIADVVNCSSILACSMSHSRQLVPMTFTLEHTSSLQDFPTIGAQFAIEMFNVRKTWNSFCCSGTDTLVEIRNSLPKKNASIEVSICVLLECLKAHISLGEIRQRTDCFTSSFENTFSSTSISPQVKSAISEVKATNPLFWPNSTTSSAKQRDRCFTFTTSISNSNTVLSFLAQKEVHRGDQTAVACARFSQSVMSFFDQFKCKLKSGLLVSMTKILVAFFLGIPIGASKVNEVDGDYTDEKCVLDLSDKANDSGDAIFDALKRCLSQFDNMGPTLATHCLTSAWDDATTSKDVFKKACLSAGRVFASSYATSSDVAKFLETSIPCPSVAAIHDCPADVQLAFLTIHQSLYEVAEETTTQIPKTSHVGSVTAPDSILRALASVRLQQRLLHKVKPPSDRESDGINSFAAEDAEVIQAEAGSSLANALLAPNLKVDDKTTHLTMKRCVESLFEALPLVPSLDVLSKALCTMAVSQFLAPYVADTCVLLHHRFRHEGNTFASHEKGWLWAGYSYSPFASQGVTYFGEKSLNKSVATFVSGEIKQLKKMLSSNVNENDAREELTENTDRDESLHRSEVGTPNGYLGVDSDIVLAYANPTELDEVVADSIEAEASPVDAPVSEKRTVTFSPSTNLATDKRFPTREDVKKKLEKEARDTEHKHLRFFSEQQVVMNPFASNEDDQEECLQPHQDFLSDITSLPEPSSSYEYYYPALRCLSDVSFIVRDNVGKRRCARKATRDKYEDLAQKIESSKDYVSSTCGKLYLMKALGYGKGAKSSLRNKEPSSPEGSQDTRDSAASTIVSDDFSVQRLEELERKKQVVIERANRLYVLPPLSPIGDNSPLRPPFQVSATLPVSFRTDISPTPPGVSPHLRPTVPSCSVPPLEQDCMGSAGNVALASFISNLAKGAMTPSYLARIQREFFDFCGVGRSMEYFYTAASLISPHKKGKVLTGHNPAQSDICVLSARPDSAFYGSVIAPKKGTKVKVTDMIENTLRKHEERKNTLENAAQGYRINGNTLIAFADVVNAVLGTIASLVAQGSSWSAIEATWSEKRKSVLEEVTRNERLEMMKRGYDGLYDEALEIWEASKKSKSKKKVPKSHSSASFDSKYQDDDSCYDYSDDDFEFIPPEEDEVQCLEYYFEHQDELDPPPATKEDLIERLFGDQSQWIFRVVTALNLSENSVTVSLPKVLEDDVPLEREPAMIDVEVVFTETAYANANMIFKRKKETEVKVSKARDADDSVREGAKRRALQRQSKDASSKTKSKESKSKVKLTDKMTFHDDLIFKEALQCLDEIPPPSRVGPQKRVYVPVPVFTTPLPVSNLAQKQMSSMSTASQTNSRSFAGINVGRPDFDPILCKRDDSIIVPPVDRVEGVPVLADPQDPLAEADCKHFWFLTSPCDVVAESTDASCCVQFKTRMSFLVLHPRDTTAAIKLLNDDLLPEDLVVFTNDARAEGALPLVIKARRIRVKHGGKNIDCSVSFPLSAIEQASVMVLARSRLWSQRCSGSTFWCYGAQLVVRSKDDMSSRQKGTSKVLPLVIDIKEATAVSDYARNEVKPPFVEYDTDFGAYRSGYQLQWNLKSGDPSPHVYSVSYSCYFFDVVRGSPTAIPCGVNSLSLGIGLLFKECFAIQKTAEGAPLVNVDDSFPGVSMRDLYASLSISPLEDPEATADELESVTRASTVVRQMNRQKLWKLQTDVRKQYSDSPQELPPSGLGAAEKPVKPFQPEMIFSWPILSMAKRQRSSKPSNSSPAKCDRDTQPDTVVKMVQDSAHQQLVRELTELASDAQEAVEKILKHLKNVSEPHLQQLLLYQMVMRKSKTLTKEERSTEAKRKKKDSQSASATSSTKDRDDKKSLKGKTKNTKDSLDATSSQHVPTKTEYDIIAEETSLSNTFVENVDKEIKKMIKLKEAELRDENFSESESDTDDVRGKKKKTSAKKSSGGGAGRSRHIAIRMLIADEILREPPAFAKESDAKTAARSAPEIVPPTSSNVKSAQVTSVGVDILLAGKSSSERFEKCWENELRWLTGSPQYLIATSSETGYGIVKSKVSYCVPVIAPIQSFTQTSSFENDGCISRYKYFVEIKPTGQEKDASRPCKASDSKKPQASNFKMIFDEFVAQLNNCVNRALRNDYWAIFLQSSPTMSGSFASIGDSDTEEITPERLASLSSIGWDFIKLTNTTLVANTLEAALLSRITTKANAGKYFQRIWEGSTSVSEMIEKSLRAVVRIICPPVPSLRDQKDDATLEVTYHEKNEKDQIVFRSTIARQFASKLPTAFGALVVIKETAKETEN